MTECSLSGKLLEYRKFSVNKKIALPNIDFADAEFKSLEFLNESRLIINIKAWNEKNMAIVFLMLLDSLITEEMFYRIYMKCQVILPF